MNLVSIFSVFLLASASILCIALVVYLNRITRSIKEIESEIKDLTSEIKPLIASSTNLSEKLNRISAEASNQLNVTKGIVNKFDDRVDTILELEEKVREGFSGPVLDLIKSLSAISNGVSAFWNAYKKK
jgi:uncharacterized protein YoxC